MQSPRVFTPLRVLAVLLLVLGLSAMHSPDLAHSASPTVPGASMAMTDLPTANPPVHDGSGSPSHQRWVGACLAVLGSLGVALSLCFLVRGSQPLERTRWPRSALFAQTMWAWSPPTRCIHRLCVMRV